MKKSRDTEPPSAHGLGSEEPRGFARMSADERRTFATLAACTRASQSDPREMTTKARLAWEESFLRKVDPDGILAPAERARRAEAARKAHYARMRLARWGKIEKVSKSR